MYTTHTQTETHTQTRTRIYTHVHTLLHIYYLFYCRGESFRTSIKQLGEIRSLLPSGINIMALTATATKYVRLAVSKTLCLHNPFVLAVPPSKPNVTYIVKKFSSLSDCFSTYAAALKQEKIHMGRILIYCRSLPQCCDVRDFFYDHLQQDRLYPPDVPVDISPYRLVDMYTSITDPVVKKNIVDCFTSVGSVLRVVICSTAFGMGVNCSDIRTVINLGPPDDVEEYIQQTGRGGRDGLPTKAILYWCSNSTKYASEKMTDYCKNTKICRRDFLFSDFENYTKNVNVDIDCCDVCKPN